MNHKDMLIAAAKQIHYDKNTGLLTWLPKDSSHKDANRWNSRYAGKECGTVSDKGYRRILFRFDGGKVMRIYSHRMAWFITYGELPVFEIDHINRNRTDNRIENLRDVPRLTNGKNSSMRSNNTSGVNGVAWNKQANKWQATVISNRVKHHIGLFKNINDAEFEVMKFRRENGFTEWHGTKVTPNDDESQAIAVIKAAIGSKE